MMTNKLKTGDELKELYESMDDERKRSLADFADFMFAQADPILKELAIPVDIPRPEKESVVGAIKRLKTMYPMIESMKVFSAASELMTEHMVSGRDSVDVIDEMETIFKTSYELLVKEHAGDSE